MIRVLRCAGGCYSSSHTAPCKYYGNMVRMRNSWNVFGIDISSSDLGNLNYALVGKALGIPETLLLQQAGAAQLRDHGEWDIVSSQFESIRQKNNDYGDQTDDQDMIKSGFELYNLIND